MATLTPLAAPPAPRPSVTRAAPPTLRKVLLVCGILASLLYVAYDVLAALRYEGYSYIDQTISELSAIDAPSRPFLIPLGFVWDALMVAFGVGVWQAAGCNRSLRIVGGLLVGLGTFGFTAPLTPMHQREVLGAGGATLTDTLHLFAGGVGSLFFLLTIGFGATAFGKRFRLYSIGTILVILVFGALASLDAPRVATNLPTPWVGVKERIMFFSALLWYAMLAVALLPVPMERPKAGADWRRS